MKQSHDPVQPQQSATPSNWDTSNRPAPVNPQVYQPTPRATRTTQPATRPAPANYVDPYLFETGYFASPEEHTQLLATAESRIQLRKDVERAPKQRHPQTDEK